MKNLILMLLLVFSNPQLSIGAENRAESCKESFSRLMGSVGQYYQMGDKWDVAVWTYEVYPHRSVRPLSSRAAIGRIFRFDVTGVKTGSDPEVAIRVSQLESTESEPAFKFVDVHLTISQKSLTCMDPDQVQTDRAMRASAQFRVDPFPINLPLMLSVMRNEPASLKKLPDNVESFVRRYGIMPDLSKSHWFEDLSGAPIQILWERNNPWPSFYKVPGAVALYLGRA